MPATVVELASLVALALARTFGLQLPAAATPSRALDLDFRAGRLSTDAVPTISPAHSFRLLEGSTDAEQRWVQAELNAWLTRQHGQPAHRVP